MALCLIPLNFIKPFLTNQFLTSNCLMSKIISNRNFAVLFGFALSFLVFAILGPSFSLIGISIANSVLYL